MPQGGGVIPCNMHKTFLEKILENKTEITKEQMIKEVNDNISYIKEKILEVAANRTKAKEILTSLQFYIGNETIQIDMIMTVNLHQIKRESMLSTNVEKYREILNSSINKASAEIEAYGKTLEEFAEELVGNNESETEA